MKTHINIYDFTIEQIEEIKVGDVITQGDYRGDVISIDSWWNSDGGFVFRTKEGQKTFRMDFNKDLTPGVTHIHFKYLFENHKFQK